MYIRYKVNQNGQTKALNENLQMSSSDFLYPKVLSKCFANLQESQVTFCYFLKYWRNRDDQKQYETIVDFCWQLSLKFGSSKTSIVGENAVQSDSAC